MCCAYYSHPDLLKEGKPAQEAMGLRWFLLVYRQPCRRVQHITFCSASSSRLTCNALCFAGIFWAQEHTIWRRQHYFQRVSWHTWQRTFLELFIAFYRQLNHWSLFDLRQLDCPIVETRQNQIRSTPEECYYPAFVINSITVDIHVGNPDGGDSPFII